jgi:MFS family permease
MWSNGFRHFFIGQTISLVGSSLSTVALSLAVLSATHSGSDLGFVLASQTLPLLIFLLIGGATADRFQRRTVLVFSNLSSGAAQGALAAVIILGHLNLSLLMCLGFVSGACVAFTGPALKGIVPQLVPGPEISRANSLLSSVKNGAKIFGPSLAGVIVAISNGGVALAVDSASFFCAAFFFWWLPQIVNATAQGGTERKPRRFLWTDIGDGWKVFRSLQWVWVVTISSALMNLVQPGAWQVLGPQIVTHRFGEADWGFVVSARGVGLLVFSLAMVKITARRYLMLGQVLSALGAVPLLALGLSDSVVLICCASAIAGLGFAASGITLDTSLQEHVPNSLISRVSSFDDLLSYLTVPLGMLLIGPLADKVGLKQTIVGAGIAYLICAWGSLLSRDVRRLEHNTENPDRRKSETPAGVTQ